MVPPEATAVLVAPVVDARTLARAALVDSAPVGVVPAAVVAEARAAVAPAPVPAAVVAAQAAAQVAVAGQAPAVVVVARVVADGPARLVDARVDRALVGLVLADPVVLALARAIAVVMAVVRVLAARASAVGVPVDPADGLVGVAEAPAADRGVLVDRVVLAASGVLRVGGMRLGPVRRGVARELVAVAMEIGTRRGTTTGADTCAVMTRASGIRSADNCPGVETAMTEVTADAGLVATTALVDTSVTTVREAAVAVPGGTTALATRLAATVADRGVTTARGIRPAASAADRGVMTALVVTVAGSVGMGAPVVTGVVIGPVSGLVATAVVISGTTALAVAAAAVVIAVVSAPAVVIVVGSGVMSVLVVETAAGSGGMTGVSGGMPGVVPRVVGVGRRGESVELSAATSGTSVAVATNVAAGRVVTIG